MHVIDLVKRSDQCVLQTPSPVRRLLCSGPRTLQIEMQNKTILEYDTVTKRSSDGDLHHPPPVVAGVLVINGQKFVSPAGYAGCRPTVANGICYCTDEAGVLSAYTQMWLKSSSITKIIPNVQLPGKQSEDP